MASSFMMIILILVAAELAALGEGKVYLGGVSGHPKSRNSNTVNGRA